MLTILIYVLLSVTHACDLEFSPSSVEVIIDKTAAVRVSCPANNETVSINVYSENTNIATANISSITLNQEEEQYVLISTVKVGETRLVFQIGQSIYKRLDVRVVRETNAARQVFEVILIIMVIQNALNLGCTVDMQLIISNIKSPKKVFIGLISQFGFMPSIAFALAKIIKLEDSIAMGAIILGSAPGGGSSNWLSFMLDGDLELSIVMTFFSSLAALGMMPLWLSIYGRQFASDDLQIPYGQIGLGLLLVILPTLVGVFCQYKLPRIATFFAKITPVFGLFMVVIAFVSGVYTNYYLFFFPAAPFGCAFLIPFCGFICGYSLTYLLHLDKKARVTICLETGIQNSILATTVALLSFKQPQSDDVVAVPLMAALMTAIQTLPTVGIYRFWYRPRYGKTGEDGESYNRLPLEGYNPEEGSAGSLRRDSHISLDARYDSVTNKDLEE